MVLGDQNCLAAAWSPDCWGSLTPAQTRCELLAAIPTLPTVVCSCLVLITCSSSFFWQQRSYFLPDKLNPLGKEPPFLLLRRQRVRVLCSELIHGLRREALQPTLPSNPCRKGRDSESTKGKRFRGATVKSEPKSYP